MQPNLLPILLSFHKMIAHPLVSLSCHFAYFGLQAQKYRGMARKETFERKAVRLLLQGKMQKASRQLVMAMTVGHSFRLADDFQLTFQIELNGRSICRLDRPVGPLVLC